MTFLTTQPFSVSRCRKQVNDVRGLVCYAPRMIKGVHTMFYSSRAEDLRAFLRDKLGFPATDAGDGWLIFQLPEADMGCHPTDPAADPPPGTHNISFYCDDIRQTVAELTERGVEFTGKITNQGYGLVTRFRMPGAGEAQLYQPLYEK